MISVETFSDGTSTAHSGRARRFGQRLARFRADESGSLIIFSLIIFGTMLLAAGMAVDIMRYETKRVTLQATLDRAILAAADLNQSLEPTEVVADYFAKAGLTGYDIDVDVNETINGRIVTASTKTEVQSLFLNLAGINTMSAPAKGTAQESIGQVEISLVLDVSGSMNSYSRIQNLKVAAKQFIDTMFDTVEEGKLSISIIPYATQVSVGPDLISYFNVTSEHSYSDCIDFISSDFNETSMDLKTVPSPRLYQRTGNFDPWNKTNDPDSNGLRVCPKEPERDIMAFSDDPDDLKNFIDDLVAEGNTSIDLGVKWGAALLDPSLQELVDDKIANGDLPSNFGGRPFAYDDVDAMKVLVVMTDGQNTDQYYLNEGFEEGLSGVWKNSVDNAYSVYNPSNKLYYLVSKGIHRSAPWGDGVTTTCGGYPKTCTDVADPGDAIRLTFQELWEDVSILYHSDTLVRPGLGGTAQSYWRTAPRSVVTGSTKNTRLDAICDAVKVKKVTVFSIGLEAPTDGAAVMKNCATSAAHFYPVEGLEISTAFAAIASSINMLRLTQ